MVRNRLSRLEKLVQTATCPDCLRIAAEIWLPGEPAPSAELVRCRRCGTEHRTFVIRIIVPGLSKSLVSLD